MKNKLKLVLELVRKKKIWALILILLLLVGVGMKFQEEEKLKKLYKTSVCRDMAELCSIYNPTKIQYPPYFSEFGSCLDAYKKMECDLNILYKRLFSDLKI